MRTEDDLRAALLTLESGAPTVDEVLNLEKPHPFWPSRHRPARWTLAVAASVLVLALVATVFALTAPHHRSGESSGTRSPGVPSLVNVGWSLVQFRVGSTWTSIDPNTTGVVIRRNGSFGEDVDECDTWIGTMHFDGGAATISAHLVNHSCPAPGPAHGATPVASSTTANVSAAHAVEKVLIGRVTWMIKGRYLTIAKAGVGELIYRRGPADPPSPSDS